MQNSPAYHRGGDASGALENEEVQFVNNLQFAQFEQRRENPDLEWEKVAEPGMPDGWTVNVTHPPAEDIRVRRALGLAIGRELMLDTLFSGDFYQPAYGVLTTPAWFGGLLPVRSR